MNFSIEKEFNSDKVLYSMYSNFNTNDSKKLFKKKFNQKIILCIFYMNNNDKIIDKVVVHAHGSYRIFQTFEVPPNIRLVLTTITSYSVTDAIHPFLVYLQKDPTVFVKTPNKLAITKEGIELQNNIRQMQKDLYHFTNVDHLDFSMLRLVGLESGETVRDLDIEFQSYNPEYYNPGIYIHDGYWQLHHPVKRTTNQFNQIDMLSDRYPLYNGDIKSLSKTKSLWSISK